MEDERDVKDENRAPKPIIYRAHKDRSSTYTPGKFNRVGDKIKRKKVVFIDRAQNIPLCTVFNYEQVDVLSNGEPSPKSTSCTCFIF